MDNVVAFKSKTPDNELGLEEFLTEITEKIKNKEITNIFAITYEKGNEDYYSYIVGSYNLSEVLGAIELTKHSILNDE